MTGSVCTLDHPAFGGTGTNGTSPFPSARFVAGYDFVGDGFSADVNAPAYNPVPVPDERPDDCNGHGTAVAGVLAGQGPIHGAAPDVSLGAYRVFGCDGTTTADFLIAAMERARADGMAVVNVAAGSTPQWATYPTAQAASRLAKTGVVVVAPTQDAQRPELFSVSAPAVGDDVIAVSSVDVHRSQLYFTTSSNGIVGYVTIVGSAPVPTSGTWPLRLVEPRFLANGEVDCAALAPGSLSGAVALMEQWNCPLTTMAATAQAVGAVGVVAYSRYQRGSSLYLDPSVDLPVVGIYGAAGYQLATRLAAGPQTITWEAGIAHLAQPFAVGVSASSPFGPTPALQLKPDISAPGSGVTTAYPVEKGSITAYRGASMAAPQVAAAAALSLTLHPATGPVSLRIRVISTAQPMFNSWDPLSTVLQAGVGQLDSYAATFVDGGLQTEALALGETGPETTLVRTVVLEKDDFEGAYEHYVGGGSGLGIGSGWNPPTLAPLPSELYTEDYIVSGSARPRLEITPPVTPAGGLYAGMVTFSPKYATFPLRAPYFGYIGDYQAIQAITPTGNGFPWLARFTGTGYVQQRANAAFSLRGQDTPVVLLHLGHPVQQLQIDLLNARNGRVVETLLKTRNLGRSADPEGFYALGWDGLLRSGGRPRSTPPGTYRLQVRVLKALGSPRTPGHWERWNSPDFRVGAPTRRDRTTVGHTDLYIPTQRPEHSGAHQWRQVNPPKQRACCS